MAKSELELLQKEVMTTYSMLVHNVIKKKDKFVQKKVTNCFEKNYMKHYKVFKIQDGQEIVQKSKSQHFFKNKPPN